MPVWGKKKRNCLKVNLYSMDELPFENNYYLLPDKEEPDASIGETISWFVQRDKMYEIEQKGMPDYLEIQEEKIMYLKNK